MPYIPACTAATMTNMTTINNSTATMTIRNFSSRVLRCQQPCWNLCPGVVADVAPLTYNTADDASITERLNDKKLHEATILTQRIIFLRSDSSSIHLSTAYCYNVVPLRRARLVLGWVTVRGYTILVFNQSHTGLLSLTISPWVGTISTGGGLGHR